MLRNIIGPVFNLKNVFFFVVFCLFFFQNPLLSAEKMIFSKKKKNMDQILTLKWQKLDQLLTSQHIYIYISFFLLHALAGPLLQRYWPRCPSRGSRRAYASKARMSKSHPNLLLWIREKQKPHKLQLLRLEAPPSCSDVQGAGVFPPCLGRRKMNLLARTSAISAADIHDPRGSQKLWPKKVFLPGLYAWSAAWRLCKSKTEANASGKCIPGHKTSSTLLKIADILSGPPGHFAYTLSAWRIGTATTTYLRMWVSFVVHDLCTSLFILAGKNTHTSWKGHTYTQAEEQ